MTVREFYGDDRRQVSDESTFGIEWTLQSDPTALYGLHWLKTTKEIYLLRGPLLPTILPDIIPGTGGGGILPTFNHDQYEVIVLGKARRASEVARALKGWKAAMGQPDSVRWVLDRLDRWVDRPNLELK